MLLFHDILYLREPLVGWLVRVGQLRVISVISTLPHPVRGSTHIQSRPAHQECKIKMTVDSLSMTTVRLLADQVKFSELLNVKFL